MGSDMWTLFRVRVANLSTHIPVLQLITSCSYVGGFATTQDKADEVAELGPRNETLVRSPLRYLRLRRLIHSFILLEENDRDRGLTGIVT